MQTLCTVLSLLLFQNFFILNNILLMLSVAQIIFYDNRKMLRKCDDINFQPLANLLG